MWVFVLQCSFPSHRGKRLFICHFGFLIDVYAWLSYVDGTPISEVTPVTTWCIHPPPHRPAIGYGYGHVWSTHIPIPFHFNQRHPPPPPPPTHPPFLKYFNLWPWNYKIKVMDVVKGQDHTISPVSNWFVFFLLHINQITIPDIRLFWNLTLKSQRSRSWVRSKVKVT